MINTIETNQSYQKFKEILTAIHIISQWLSTISVFSLFSVFKIVSSVIMSGQQPPCHPMLLFV